MNLPQGITTMSYGTDIVLIGVNLTPKRYQEIMQTLPEADRQSIIGWRSVGKGGAASA